jgi:hypothetical protein
MAELAGFSESSWSTLPSSSGFSAGEWAPQQLITVIAHVLLVL